MKNIFISLGVIASVIILGIFVVNNSKNGVINRYCKSFPNNLFLKILNYYPDTYEALDYEEKYSDTENYILWE